MEFSKDSAGAAADQQVGRPGAVCGKKMNRIFADMALIR